MRRLRTLAIALSLLAACATASSVESETRRNIPTSPSATDVPVGGTLPTSSTTTTEPESPQEALSVTFVLGEVRVEVGLVSTSAPTPPGGTDGFRRVVELDDGTLLASGVDAAGDGSSQEYGALWRSDNATDWRRVGADLSVPPGVQEIADLVRDDTGTRAFGHIVDPSGPTPRIESLTEWRSDPLDDWAAIASLDETSVRQALVVDGDAITVGAREWNTPGGYLGAVVWHAPDDGEQRTVFVDTDAGGTPRPGSEVYALAVDDTDPSVWIAVGNTTLTDTARLGDERLADGVVAGFPSDVAVWRSADSGVTWELDDASRFADLPGAQGAITIEQVAGEWWMLAGEQNLGASFARRLYRSTDARLWELDDYRRPKPLTGNERPGARGLWTVDGLVVIVDEVSDTDGPSAVMTMIDPLTGATDQHDLTVELGGLHQLNDVLELSDGVTGVGFGRIERGPVESDLQVVEIRRTEPPPPEPEPDEPLPTTTAPPSGGGSSSA